MQQNTPTIPKKGLALLKFGAEWCGPCKMLAPVLESFKQEVTDVTVVDLDADLHRDLASQYGIRAVPTIYLLKDGEVMASVVGMQTLSALKELVAKHR